MTLASGSMLGPYEILSLRGAGGMGEVYRARDTRLDRIVAIKVLSAALSADELHRRRFEREAKAISALAHPNICALFDVGRHEGAEYLVMEYLEGETLAEKLAGGAISASMVLRYGVQIADALQHAHRAGITHRDLKPGNIMITSSGVRLLDFGLAKFLDPSESVSHDSPTVAQQESLTATGTIVGTAHYMSPEQVEGKALDHRSDIFSLGVILYEMVTGRRPFRGDSAASLFAAILSTEPPPVRTLAPAASPLLERTIATALEKSPDDRFQTAHDVGLQLRWLGEPSQPSVPSLPSATSGNRNLRAAALIGATALIAALLTWAVVRFLHSPSAVGRVSLEFAPPPFIRPGRSSELNDFVISPLGDAVALVAMQGATGSLYIRNLDSFDFKKVEGADNVTSPFWSSDGQWIGYSSAGKLWKTKVSGETSPESICDINAGGARASWSGHTILFADARGNRKEIYRVADTGGAPVKITSLVRGEWRHSWPLLLADGRHFLYESFATGSLDRTLILASFDSPKRSVLLRDISFARIGGKDRLVYVRDGNLLSQRFDLENGVMIGDASTISPRVAYFYPTARADFDASPSGAVVFRTNTSTGRLVQVDRKGAVVRTIDDHSIYWDHAISPDGKRAAVTLITPSTGLMDIWLYDLVRGTRERFTSEPGIEVSPAWSPDGRSLAYAQAEGVFPHIVRRALDSAVAEDIAPRDAFEFSPSFTPDGEYVFYDSDNGNDIYRHSLKTGRSESFLKTSFSEGSPEVSPDGKWLAYTSDATGVSEVYLQALAGEPVRYRISTAGGSKPTWRRDAKELFYIGPTGEVMSATPGREAGWNDPTIVDLFRISDEVRGFAAMADGQTFLISDWKPGAADDLIHVVLGSSPPR